MSKGSSVALCMIVKNERKNLERLLSSVEGCFDAIHITDTGSDDGTVEFLKSEKAEELAGCDIQVHNFKWNNSFCDARNYSFSHSTCDYLMWMDGDDALLNKEAFIAWKKEVMPYADGWFATYNYALDTNGKPIVSFMRERVVKRSNGPKWKYDLHEGITLQPTWKMDYALIWAIDHHRDKIDIQQDKSRNLTILEKLESEGKLDSRLKFYYGKELYEQDRALESIRYFEDALKDSSLDLHDRILSHQYASYAYFKMAMQTRDDVMAAKFRLLDKSISMALDGIKYDVSRAELYVAAADAYLSKGELHKAVPLYGAATHCFRMKELGSPYEGAIYNFVDCYGFVPHSQMIRCLVHMGRLDEANFELTLAQRKYPHEKKSIDDMLLEVISFQDLTTLDHNQVQTTDIVFTTPPTTLYEFDDEAYETKAMGGSETALIQMAVWLKKLTGQSVKVFCHREHDLLSKNGVEWISNRKLNEYMKANLPQVHIQWRHNTRLTKAPSYLWCHDLITQGVESAHNFDKILCLSNFHRDFVNARQGVPLDKIIVTDNGISPEKFKFDRKPKNPNKVVWQSSPDRGLERAITVCERVRSEFPDLELHVYYGLENLYRYGLGELANKLKAMMDERPWVKYHGFTEQSKMYHEISDAVVWCHPCNFIETNCITAKEMLALQIYPVTRALGGLRDTLKEAQARGDAVMLEHDCVTELEFDRYAFHMKVVLKDERWRNMEEAPKMNTWESVANQWILHLNIESKPEAMKLVGS